MSIPFTPPTRVLVMSRRRSIRTLLGCSAFVAIGVVYVVTGHGGAVWPWVAVVFFGLGAIVMAAEVTRPSTLTLRADGFIERPALSPRRLSRSWPECGEFVPAHVGTTMVTYASTRTDVARLRSLNRRLIAGADEAIRAGYGGLSAIELAALMNAYRRAALGL